MVKTQIKLQFNISKITPGTIAPSLTIFTINDHFKLNL